MMQTVRPTILRKRGITSDSSGINPGVSSRMVRTSSTTKMNKIIVIFSIVGVCVAQYSSNGYSQSSTGSRSPLSAQYSARGGNGGYQSRGSYAGNGRSAFGAAGLGRQGNGGYGGIGAYGSQNSANGAQGNNAYGNNRAQISNAYGNNGAQGSNAYGSNGAYGLNQNGRQGGLDNTEAARYEFKYDVNVPEYAVEFGHEEQRDGDNTNGAYYVVLPDGRRQLVEYTADLDGYHPRISYTEAAGSGRSGINGYGSQGNYQGSAGRGGYQSGSGSYQGNGGLGSSVGGYGGSANRGLQSSSFGTQGNGGYASSGGNYQGSSANGAY